MLTGVHGVHGLNTVNAVNNVIAEGAGGGFPVFSALKRARELLLGVQTSVPDVIAT